MVRVITVEMLDKVIEGTKEDIKNSIIDCCAYAIVSVCSVSGMLVNLINVWSYLEKRWMSISCGVMATLCGGLAVYMGWRSVRSLMIICGLSGVRGFADFNRSYLLDLP